MKSKLPRLFLHHQLRRLYPENLIYEKEKKPGHPKMPGILCHFAPGYPA